MKLDTDRRNIISDLRKKMFCGVGMEGEGEGGGKVGKMIWLKSERKI